MDVAFKFISQPRLRRKLEEDDVPILKLDKEEMANMLREQIIEGLKEMDIDTFMNTCCEFHFFYEYKNVDNLAFYPKRVYF